MKFCVGWPVPEGHLAVIDGRQPEFDPFRAILPAFSESKRPLANLLNPKCPAAELDNGLVPRTWVPGSKSNRSAARESLVFETFCKDKLAPLTLRLALGLVCISHGYLKIMAAGGTTWFPGLPTGWQLLIAWGEFAAGLAVLVGFRCRWAALVILATTAGTLILWQGWNLFHLPVRSLEPTFLLLLSGLALLFLGGGELSVDARAGGGGGLAPKPAKKK